jgi:hypothetical protein
MANTYLPQTGIYFDGDYTKPTAVSLPLFDSQQENTTDVTIFTQKFQQVLDKFKPLPLNTRHGDATDGSVWPSSVTYRDYFLVDESPLDHLGASVVEWTRTYSQVPASFDLWEGFAYSFIGFLGQTGVNVTAVTGRERFTRSITSRLANDYFLVSSKSNPIANPSDNKTYLTPGDIPFIRAQRYYYPANPLNPETASNPFFEVDYIGDSPPFASATVPSRTTYVGWLVNAQKYGWGAGVVPVVTSPTPAHNPPAEANPGQIPAEDSRLTRYRGNIWLRQTRYILAL